MNIVMKFFFDISILEVKQIWLIQWNINTALNWAPSFIGATNQKVDEAEFYGRGLLEHIIFPT